MPLIRSHAVRSLAIAASLAGVAVGAGAAVAAPAYSPVTIVQNIPDAKMGGFTADGSELWVAQNRNNKVTVIDTATNQVKQTISLAGNHKPENVVADPQGRFMIVVGYSGFAWKIDASTYQVLQTWSLDDSLWGVAIKPDGSGFYTASTPYGFPATIQYVDIATGAITTIPIPSRPDGLWGVQPQMSRDGSRVYVTGQGFGTTPNVEGYFTVDTATNTIIDTHAYDVPVTSYSFGYSSALDADTGRLYILDDDAGITTVVDAPTGNLLSTFSSPRCDNYITDKLALTSTGMLMAQVSSFCGTEDLTMIDPSTGATLHTFTAVAGGVAANGHPYSVAFSPNGCRVYTFNGGSGGTWSTNGSVSVLGVPCPPAAPPNLAVTAGDGSLNVSYTTPDDNGSAITDYEYSIDGGTTWKSARTTGTSFTIPGLTNGTRYSVKVRAKNSYGAGQASTAATGTPVAAAGGGSNSQAAAETTPAITIPAASVSSGATLTSTVSPSVAGTVKVTATLAGRTVCTATKTATRAGRMTVTCNLTKGAKAVISKKAVTLKVTARLTDAKGKTATASRNVKVARYVVRTPVTG